MRELTDDEKECLYHTRELWNDLVNLKQIHPDDLNEYRRDIHNIQNRIMARPTQETENIEQL